MDFQKESLLKDIYKDDAFIKLLKEEQISDEEIENNVLMLASYNIKKKHCLSCPGLDKCSQELKGLEPFISYDNHFNVEYNPCKFQQEATRIEELHNNLIVLACNIDDYIPSKLFTKKATRNEIYTKMKNVYLEYEKGKLPKGIYLHGPYGTGKSFIMGCFARKYADEGSQVVFAYYPDLVRQLKNAITTGNLEQMITLLKTTDVLFLDDFGGESSSAFIRDEILSPVLQDRMEYHRLTFMTSNLDENTLHNHLAETNKDVDELKASRIEERIKTLMEFVSLNDENYRN